MIVAVTTPVVVVFKSFAALTAIVPLSTVKASSVIPPAINSLPSFVIRVAKSAAVPPLYVAALAKVNTVAPPPLAAVVLPVPAEPVSKRFGILLSDTNLVNFSIREEGRIVSLTFLGRYFSTHKK